MNLDHHCFQASKLSENQKKRSSPKIQELMFSRNLVKNKKSPKLRCRPESNYWRDADVDHSQIIGGGQLNYWGDASSPSPPCFGTPDTNAAVCHVLSAKLRKNHAQCWTLTR